MNVNKRIALFLVLSGLIFLILGVTFAYWNWMTTEEQRTSVVFTIANNFSCSANGGGDITVNDVTLIPTTVTEATKGNYIKREVKVKPTLTIPGIYVYMDLWLDINDIGSGLSNSDNFMYAFTTSSTSPTDGVISSGNFKGKTVGDRVNLLSGMGYNKTVTETYYLWIWLDAAETSPTTMNQTFSLSLNGSCTDQPYQSVGSDVVIDIPNGLIPIMYEDAGTVKTVSTSDNSWGNYDNKEWANAVMVKESGTNTREYYQNNIGVTIPEEDILAYYVYVPRYKYKIWETGLSSAGKEQEIEIIFENKNTPKSNGSAVGEYLTHPAFTFGNTELNGIWIGKFETGGTSTVPLIKPNILSLRSQKVSQAFTTTQIFGTNSYGIKSSTDSHMAKNSEWGAAAYLTNSKYGRCTNGVCEEVRRNNNSAYYTGYSEVNVATTGYSETSSSTNQFGTGSDITRPYNTEIGYKASTTGNIYGIYDMSGGAWERVMGVLADPSGNPRSGESTTNNSGFNGMLSDGSMYTSGTNFPDSKYYDLYTSTNTTSYSSSLTLTACNGGICYGHGFSEVANWYKDSAAFVYATGPWVGRGGRFYNGTGAGPFYFDGTGGGAFSGIGSRAALCVV